MKKFIIEESFVSYADIEIYADSKDEALAKYHRGDYPIDNYSISDYKEDYTLLAITAEGENQPLETFSWKVHWTVKTMLHLQESL